MILLCRSAHFPNSQPKFFLLHPHSMGLGFKHIFLWRSTHLMQSLTNFLLVPHPYPNPMEWVTRNMFLYTDPYMQFLTKILEDMTPPHTLFDGAGVRFFSVHLHISCNSYKKRFWYLMPHPSHAYEGMNGWKNYSSVQFCTFHEIPSNIWCLTPYSYSTPGGVVRNMFFLYI